MITAVKLIGPTRQHHDDPVVVKHWSTTSFHPSLCETSANIIIVGQESKFRRDWLRLTLLEYSLDCIQIIGMDPEVRSVSIPHT